MSEMLATWHSGEYEVIINRLPYSPVKRGTPYAWFILRNGTKVAFGSDTNQQETYRQVERALIMLGGGYD